MCALSLEAWFRAAPGVGERVLLGGNGMPRLVVDGPRLVFAVPTPAGESRAVADLSRLGIEDAGARLVHAIGTVRDDWACLYVEGALAATARLGGEGREWAVSHRAPRTVGFEGELGLARLYTRALAGREVLANHRATRRDGKPTGGALWSAGPIDGKADLVDDKPDEPAGSTDGVYSDHAASEGGAGSDRVAPVSRTASLPATVAPQRDAPTKTSPHACGSRAPHGVPGSRIRRTVSARPDDRPGFGSRVKRVASHGAVQAGSRRHGRRADATPDAAPHAAAAPPSTVPSEFAHAPAWTVAANVSGFYALPAEPGASDEPARGDDEARRELPAIASAEPVGVEAASAGTSPQSPRSTASDDATGAEDQVPPTDAPPADGSRADGDASAPAVPEPQPALVRAVPGDALRLDVTELSGCALVDAIAHWPVALPDWLSLDGVTGVASGTVPASAAGTRERIAVAVANRHGARARLALDLHVGEATAPAPDLAPGAVSDPLDTIEAAMRTAADAVPALRALVRTGREPDARREASP